MVEPTQQPDNGWHEWSKYVLKELERMNKWMGEIQRTCNAQRVDIATLKVKAGVWGLLGGLIPVLILLLVYFFTNR